MVGAFGLHLIEDFLRDTVLNIGGVEVNIGERWALILGVLFILSVMVFPYGIVGTVRLRWQKWRGADRALRRAKSVSLRRRAPVGNTSLLDELLLPLAVGQIDRSLQSNPTFFRFYVHPPQNIKDTAASAGLKAVQEKFSGVWQIVVFERA